MPSNKKTPAKKVNKSKKKTKTSVLTGSQMVFGQLNQWAHAGTEESLKKLENFIVREENKDLREYAGLAYGEAAYFYYSPKNEREEKEFELACMVKKEDEYLWKLISEADRLRYEVGKLKIEKAVYKRLIKKQTDKKKKSWQYRGPEDYIGLEGKLQAIEEDIEYQVAWLKEARAMIKTKRYQNIPDDIFEHMHTDFENGSFWVDDFSSFDPCCEEPAEDNICCPHCSSTNIIEDNKRIQPIGNYDETKFDDIPF